jgi:hypothetical protein
MNQALYAHMNNKRKKKKEVTAFFLSLLVGPLQSQNNLAWSWDNSLHMLLGLL